MSELFFPTQAEIELMHVKVIEETGGSYGLRDAGALESALKAAENRAYYEDAPLAVLGATYTFHLSQAHAFIDGNKRIAAVAAELFLEMNGTKLKATNEEIIKLYLDIAASKISREDVESKFAEWIIFTGKDDAK